MNFKLDENLGARWIGLFQEAGHGTDTVLQENLSGSSDQNIFEACIREQRCLVSLDMDFADILRFPPARTSGVALLRPPKGNSRRVLEHLIRNLLTAMATESIEGRLWVVELGRIRVHERS